VYLKTGDEIKCESTFLNQNSDFSVHEEWIGIIS